MARQKPTNGKSKKRGPYLSAAFFCERTIEDKQDNTISIVRMVDTLMIQLHPSTPLDFPSEANRLPVPISALVSFKTGDSPGSHTLKLVMESPSGKKAPPVEQQFVLSKDPQGGFNYRLNSVIQVMKGGLFWLHVYLDDKHITKTPFLIKIERPEQPVSTSHQPGNPALFP
jgi:hypothetical protein